jgi:phage terminase large subunit-like protein
LVRIAKSQLTRIVVAIDPAITVSEDSDWTGIVVAGRGPHQPETCQLAKCPGHGYVLDDRTGTARPHDGARRAVAAYDKWEADRIIAEVNQGGLMVEETVRAVRLGAPFQGVHAARGKRPRAEPVAALWEQGRVHLVGSFPELEDQLLTWSPDQPSSPDRLDAMVWALTALGLIGGQGAAFMAAWAPEADELRAGAQGMKPLPGLPHFVQHEPSELRKGCKHRFFQGLCVNCGGPAPG